MNHPPQDAALEIVEELELIPGQPTTVAQVWMWRGPVPHVSELPLPWVVLHGDDWPMSPHVARKLAAALVRGADRAEAGGNTGTAATPQARDDIEAPLPGIGRDRDAAEQNLG